MAITVNTYQSGVSWVSPGDQDPGYATFDGDFFWQCTQSGGTLILNKYDKTGPFIASYTMTVPNWSGAIFCIGTYFSGYLWLCGKSNSGSGDGRSSLAQIDISGPSPSLVTTIPVAPVTATSADALGICHDGTHLYVIAFCQDSGAKVITTKLDTAGATIWQISKAANVVNSNIVFDGTYLWESVGHTLYQIDTADGSTHNSANLVGGSTYINWLAYSPSDNVLWAWDDSGNQALYKINITTLALLLTVDGFVTGLSPFFQTFTVSDTNGDVYAVTLERLPDSSKRGNLIQFGSDGTLLDTYHFPPGAQYLLNAPEFLISVDGAIWGGIFQSDDTYALIGTPAAVPPVSIICDNPPDGTVGVAYTHTFPASGGTEPYTFAITAGALPDGITLATDTGIASGTPTVAGTFTFTVQVTDSTAATATVECSITIAPAPLDITCDNPPQGTVGAAYTHTFPATGGTEPYIFAIVSGALPPGIVLDPATGIVTGVPTTEGHYTFTIRVTSS